MTIEELGSLSKTEKIMVERAENDEIAVAAILERRKYLKENSEYTSTLMRDQYRARFSAKNEKETATMRILYDEDT